ncbi:MAG: AI-2E family transporter [Cellulosilyticaceae bacterium]
MFEKIKNYRKFIGYSFLVVFVGSLLMLSYKVIDNGPYLLGQVARMIVEFLDIISPIIYAFIFAYLLYVPMMFIETNILKLFKNKKLTKKAKGSIRLVSSISIFIIVILLIVTIINYIVPPFINNVKILLHSIPDFEQQITLWLKEVTEYLDTLNIDYTSNGQLMIELKSILLSVGQSILNGLTSWVGHLGGFVVDTVVTVILTFYFLLDKEKLFGAIDKLGTIICTPKVKVAIKGFFKDLDDIVGKFLVGTIFASFIVGVISTILMLLIKHPFAILIGVAAGLTNVIPYVGPIIGSGLAFVLGIFTSLELGITGAVLLLLYQQVDGNVIQPKIVGDKVGLEPVWILMAVLIGGSYFGGLGMIIAVPTAALIAVYMDRLYKKVRAKKKVE